MSKYTKYSGGQWEALGNILGGEEVIDGLLSGTKKAAIEDAVRLFFDRHGRCIPAPNLRARACDANRNFRLNQPTLDYAERHARLTEFLGQELIITAAQFKDTSERQLASLRENPSTANALKGVVLPVIMPRIVMKDLGACLEEILLPAVERSYTQKFPGRTFNNRRQGDLAGKVTLVSDTRHERLVAGMAKSSMVGIFLPNPLQGFSVHAQREQIAAMPENFVLSALDMIMAMIMYPDVLARDFNTPGLDLSALQWQSAEYSLFFEAYDDKLLFVYETYLGVAGGSYSGGVLFLG